MNLISTFEGCYQNGQTSKIIIDDTKKIEDSEVKVRFDMPYNKTNEQREVLWTFKNLRDTDLDINMYCLGERKHITAYGYSANDTSSIFNITQLNCSDTFIAKPYTISTISIVSMMGNSSIEFQHKYRPTDKQLGVILIVIFSLLVILLIFVLVLLYRKRQLAKLDKLLNDGSHH